LAKAKRVFEVAKELGVKSKVIVEKCEAEGVPGITNHMSTVKVGLEQTIHEWFGDQSGGTATAVETADKVDLDKAKAKKAARKKAAAATPKAKAAKKKAEPAEEQADDTADETAKAETQAKPEPSGQEAPAEPVEAKSESKAEAQSEPAAESAEQDKEEQAAPAAEATGGKAKARPKPAEPETQAPDQREQVGPKGQANVPNRPEVVKPAGERLTQPTQAKLSGPKVVRIEQPDQIRKPRPARSGPGGPRGGGGGGAGGPSGGQDTEGITRSRGPARGGGVRGGGGEDSGGGGGGRGKQRRMMNTRRGRSADALPTGPSKLSEQDLMELDAKLKGAPGFIRGRRREMKRREGGGGHIAQTAVQTGGKVEVQEPITIKSLSAATGIKTAEIIKYLFKKGVMATINSGLDTEMAMEVALEYDIELEVKEQQTAEQQVIQTFTERKEVDVQKRPPIVAVLGHVDHGKTSLLDKIRKEDVAAHEDGGITQHVGAYRVTIETESGEKTVVFLDTPGHEAFTSMRSRGAGLTDIVVLVVAADDGVMPQTIESINHAKAAGVPLVVALNKCDTPQATDENTHKIYGQLAEHGLNPAEWGGETEIVKTSAISGEGVPDLVEVLDYQAELLELKADYGGPARGSVIEAEMQPGRGCVARVMVQEGEIKVGDNINIGRSFGRVRDMTDDRGRRIQVAGPATPLELSGIDEMPDAGDKFYITETLQAAESIAKQFREKEREKQLAAVTKVTLDNFAATLKAGETQELRVVLKADVQGSVETLQKSLSELGNDEVTVRVLHAAVGGITESDVILADASDAIIFGFHVVATPAVREIADERSVEIRTYRVIYELIDEVKRGMEGLLAPEIQEEPIGTAEVKEVFKIGKLGNIAGCIVTDGAIQKSGKMRLIRDGGIVTEGRDIESLKRVKDDANEVRAGTECGIRLDGFEDIKPGDTLQCYRVKEVKRTLD